MAECVRLQEFDTTAFGCPFYRVTDIQSPEIEEALASLTKRTPLIVDAKIPAEQLSNSKLLQKFGFRKICTQIEFTHNLEGVSSPDATIPMDSGLNLSEGDLSAHARNFVFDRFSLDPALPMEGKNRLYYEWARRSVCLGLKEVVNIERNFCSFAEEPDALRIDLLSVLDKRFGYGAALLIGVLNHAVGRGKKHVKVVTECENGSSWRLYARTGFTVSNYYSAFHFVAF